MSEPTPSIPPPSLFSEPPKEKSFPAAAVAIAAAAVTILVVVLVLMARRNAPAPLPSTVQPLAAYASNLTISGVQMSEAGSMSGGKSIYIDGHIDNKGAATVTGVRAQVIFANDQAMPPQLETVQLRVIYMRQPYVDTRPLGAAPFAPGAGADFRMIFDDINDNWNQQTPAIRIIGVSTR